ncbi:unnamed protein product [Sphagnum balticum]
MECSNFLMGIWNFVTLVLSLPIIAVGIWLAKQHNTVCYHFLEWPVIIIGGTILVVSLLGMLGAWCNINPLLVLYLIAMFFLMASLFIFTIFAFVVTNAGGGDAVPGKGFQEYHLGNYSTWLQKQVDKASLWDKIQICLNDAKVCNKLDNEYPTSTQFDAASLTPVQSGCCKPPSSCGFTFDNATTWKGTPAPSADPDCSEWNNNQLCFNCTSCKAGVLQDIKHDWRKVAIVNIIMVVLLIIIYSVGCCARQNGSGSSDKMDP